jgi:hypothetical protein
MNSQPKRGKKDFSLLTPVLFVIFNRPETTRKVFEEIRRARPARLYIVADGPRPDRAGEAEKCKETRQIASQVDWNCEVKTLFREVNFGCGKGLSNAIGWFFEFETEGIILEDDCLPSPSFFRFCSELLHRYRDDTRVMQIGGINLEDKNLRDEEYSYGFSNLIYIWGWATWRRAWKLYDFHMNHYLEIKKKEYLPASYDTVYERDFNQYIFEKMHTGDEVTNSSTIWDYQWLFACKIHSGLIIVPNRNLIKNLGFGENSTNTHDPKGVGHNLRLEEMNFPLHHPDFMMVNKINDRRIFRLVCTTLLSRFKSRVKQVLPQRVVQEFLKPLAKVFT